MAHRDEIVAFLNAHLEIDRHPDYLPVGLQVPGAEEVSLVVTGVSASLELFERAGELGAQMVIVHHGLFWDRDPRRIGPRQKARLKSLFDHDLSLVAYHLALDAHPTDGNNAIICARLGLTPTRPFGGVGFVAEADPRLSPRELLGRVQAEINPEPLAFMHGPDAIRTVAVVSGSAHSLIEDAADQGIDAFLTGEPGEPTAARALESTTHFIAAGHYATEVFGVQALGRMVERNFGVEHRFVDIPNPV